MYKIYAFIIVLVGLILPKCSIADSSNILLSLREAVLLSLRFNTAIRNAEIDRVAQRFELRVAQRQFEWQYSLEAGLGVLNGDQIFPGYNVAPGMSWQSRYGTKVGIQGTQSRQAKKVEEAEEAGGNYFTSAKLSITQPLLKGAGREVVEAGLRSHYDQEEARRLTLRDSISSAINSVVQAYRALILANNGVETQKRQLEEAKRNTRIIKARIQAGRIAPTQEVQEELNLQQIEFALEARLNEQDKARQNLLEAIGLDPDLQIEVPNDVAVDQIQMPDQQDTIQLALAHNTGYQVKLIGTRAIKRALQIQKNSQKWQLDLAASATIFGQGQSPGRSLLGQTKKSLTKQIQLSLKIPIQDYAGKLGLLNAQINVQKSEFELAAARRKLITEIKTKLFSLRSLIKQLQISEQRIELAKRVYEIEKQKQLNGSSTSLDVSTSQNNYINAQNDFIKTKIDYLNLVDDLNLKLGLTLKHWGIELYH